MNTGISGNDWESFVMITKMNEYIWFSERWKNFDTDKCSSTYQSMRGNCEFGVIFDEYIEYVSGRIKCIDK